RAAIAIGHDFALMAYNKQICVVNYKPFALAFPKLVTAYKQRGLLSGRHKFDQHKE
ncbi:MAG: hypothetical protein ACI9S7_000351, partial [Candidatus Paceibacteria bacterium]